MFVLKKKRMLKITDLYSPIKKLKKINKSKENGRKKI